MGNAPSSSAVKETESMLPVAAAAAAAPIQASVNYRSFPKYFSCQICLEEVLTRNNLFRNGCKCGQRICTECVIKYIKAKLEDNEARIRCPAFQCAIPCIRLLEPLDYRRVIGPELFVRWCDALCERALMGVEKSYCPNRNCSALILNECGEIAKRVICPNCKTPFCFECKIPWHQNFTCIQIQGGEGGGRFFDRNDHDRAFVELSNQMKWKRCPQCYHCVELTEGCLIMHCRCGTTFCYNCGKQAQSGWCDNCLTHHPLLGILCFLAVFAGLFIMALILALINKRYFVK